MQNVTALVMQHDEDEQQAECECRHDEEINTRQAARVISEERAPGLRGRLRMSDHVFRDGSLADSDPKFKKLTMDPRCAPKRVLSRHSADQGLNVRRNCGPASLAWPRLPRPEESRALAVPSHHGIRLDDHHRPKTAGPESVEQNPEDSIEPREANWGL